jgi:hypothetical protein
VKDRSGEPHAGIIDEAFQGSRSECGSNSLGGGLDGRLIGHVEQGGANNGPNSSFKVSASASLLTLPNTLQPRAMASFAVA